MNNTAAPAADSGGFLGSQNIGGFGYGIGISFGILLLIITITLASYYCTRSAQSSSPPSHHRRWQSDGHGSAITTQPDSAHCVIDMGLDEATLLSYPVVTYSDVKIKRKERKDSCCSICLADYKGKDLLRELPDCGHLFHVKCVDPWLRLNPTCPNCRTSPLPTPLSTPLAEVVPLTGRRD
ncbi:putative transcription factor C2H2 family [Helianthus annuus]|nr:putative transcription factor C2H2 family [Helianthus annuus]KAJ0958233.1 putative transcription factor C2H2 family [Helianthus annuus]